MKSDFSRHFDSYCYKFIIWGLIHNSVVELSFWLELNVYLRKSWEYNTFPHQHLHIPAIFLCSFLIFRKIQFPWFWENVIWWRARKLVPVKPRRSLFQSSTGFSRTDQPLASAGMLEEDTGEGSSIHSPLCSLLQEN